MRPPCAPAHLLRIKTGPGSWDLTSGLSIIGRVLNQLSFSRMEPRARIELAFPLYRSGASPAMLAGLNTWRQRSESNARRTTRPWQLNYFDMERVERIELSWPAWKAGTQPISHTRLKYTYLLFSYQRTHFDGSAWTVRSFQPWRALTRSFGRQDTLVGHPGFEPGVS